MNWTQTARNFAEQLQQLSDESLIEKLATEILTQIYELTEAKKRKRALATVSKEIRKIYPNDEVSRPL
ncbi:MAG: hypothetical protein F6K47_41405, partial [Symploca sp. SIO2E6]|nr:hypothetical protein [Symploca sp. SIO2E6]